MTEEMRLYDRYFTGWLEKRVKRIDRANGRGMRASGGEVRRYSKVDVTALLRAGFDPRDLARLDALGFAR